MLGYARRNRWPVAHSLFVRAGGPMRVSGRMACPVDGFEPLVREMVFERNTLSAYGHTAFADLMQRRTGAILVVGLGASLTFMATAFDAFERGHRLIVVADALGGQQGVSACAEDHEAVALDVSRVLGFAVASAGAAREAAITINARIGEQDDERHAE